MHDRGFVNKMVATLFLGVLILVSLGKEKEDYQNFHNRNEIVSAVEKCAINDYSCYRSAARTIHKNFSLQEIFDTLRDSEKQPLIFQGCHSVLHFMGQEDYRRKGDIARILAEGSPVCFAGFYHGALEEHLREKILAGGKNAEELLRAEVPVLCTKENFMVLGDYFECLHGLGHALMFATDNEVPQALELCDLLGDSAIMHWCYSGVFMENSTSSTSRDHPSRYLKKEEPWYPCTVLSEKYLSTCYLLQSFYIVGAVGFDWQKMFGSCDTVPRTYRGQCFNAVGQLLVGHTQDMYRMNEICSMVPEHYRVECFFGVVGNLSERFPQSLNKMPLFCNIVDPQYRSECYNQMLRVLPNRVPSRKELDEICAFVENAGYQTRCRRVPIGLQRETLR